MEFDKIVKKLQKKGQKLFSINDLGSFIEEHRTKNTEQRIYKLVHRLIASGVLISIRKGMYLYNAGGKLDPEDYYWQIAKKIIAENYLGQGIITGVKALQINLRDYSIPETLHIIIPKGPSSYTIIQSYMLVTQVLRRDAKSSLYSIVKTHATHSFIEGTEFLIACPEHAILEALTIRSGSDIEDSTIRRFLHKNASQLREAVFAEVLPYRYISAVNRLKYLSFDLGEQGLYAMMIRLIEREGKGCHLSRDFLKGKKSRQLKRKIKNQKLILEIMLRYNALNLSMK